MYVVSGCPRSGTSLMMEIFRTSLGNTRIIGQKFPAENKVARRADDTEEIFAYKRYLERIRQERDPIEARDLNPDGFWEGPFTVKGVAYRPEVRKLVKQVGAEAPPSVCKIVSQGLSRSNPVYIDSVVFMLRRPEAVAKSQERLTRSFSLLHPDTRKHINLFEGAVVQSPQMFIEVTLGVAKWSAENPEVPLYIVKFENLIRTPKKVLDKLGRKLREDLRLGVKCVRKELDRSSKATIDHPLLSEANQVYDWFLSKDWAALEKYRLNRRTEQNKQRQQWFCARSASMAQDAVCSSCVSDPSFRASLRADAVKRELNWQDQPCAYECAYEANRQKFVTLTGSIKNNHWKEVG